MGRRKYSFCQGFRYGRIKTLCSPYQVLILGKYKPRSTTAHDILHCQYLFHKNYAKMQKQRVKNEFNLVIQLLVEPLSSSKVSFSLQHCFSSMKPVEICL